VAGADRDAEIVDDLTSGGLLSERGESSGVLPSTAIANTPRGQLETDISETRAREAAVTAQEFGDDIDAGAVFGSAADPLGSGGTVTESRAPASGDPANENAFEEFIEGGARVGTDLPAGVTQTETAVEVATNAPSEIRAEGAGDVGETGVAVGRDIATRTAREAAENPAEFGGGVAAGLLVGAGAGARGTGSLGDAVRAELDPRVGPFGTTAETRVFRGLRDRVRGDDTDTGGLTPDDDTGLGSGGSGQLLDADTVDAERGVSDPSVATRVRGDAERQAAEIRDTIGAFNQRVRERTAGTDRGQAQLTGLTPESDRDTGGGSVQPFDDFDGTRRDDILEGSPRDRMSDDIAERTRAQRRQFGGDFEQPFDERGGGTRTPADRATFDPDADTGSGPVADAVARRQDAEQRFDRRASDTREGDATTAEVLGGAFSGGLSAGLLGTPGSDTAPGLLDRPRFDVGGRPDVDATPDSDVFTDFDFGQDIGGDTDTGGDLDTDTDLTDPDLTEPVRDPPTDTPRDPPRDPPGDPPTDRTRDPPRPFDPEDDTGDDDAALFATATADELIDSGLLSGSEAAADLFGGR
jgi:hypothetical protein